MPTDLDTLLAQIAPAKTIDVVASRVDQALNTFTIDQAKITDWGEYQTVLSKFFRHAENHVLNMGSFQSPDLEFEWERCCQILNKAFGESGDKAAFEMVRTGVEGGLRNVLQHLAKQMVNQYSGREIAARITQFWNNLSFDQQFAVMDEYLTKYGHLLPEELTEGSAARLKANFVQVLNLHPHLTKRLRDTGSM